MISGRLAFAKRSTQGVSCRSEPCGPARRFMVIPIELFSHYIERTRSVLYVDTKQVLVRDHSSFYPNKLFIKVSVDCYID